MTSKIHRSPGRIRMSQWLGRNWARLAYAVHVEPTWLETNRWELPIADLGPGMEGLRIVQLSDLHCGRQLPAKYLQDSIAAAQNEKPDLVVLTGDFVHKGYKYVERAADSVAQLAAPFGV